MMKNFRDDTGNNMLPIEIIETESWVGDLLATSIPVQVAGRSDALLFVEAFDIGGGCASFYMLVTFDGCPFKFCVFDGETEIPPDGNVADAVLEMLDDKLIKEIKEALSLLDAVMETHGGCPDSR